MNNINEIASRIVAAYVSKNNVPVDQLPTLMADTCQALHRQVAGVVAAAGEPCPAAPVPAVSIKKSITPDYLICLEDGRKLKTMKRHLFQRYGMTPDQYRAKWKLPSDYPMVAPNYSAARSSLAKSLNFGRKEDPAPVPAEAPKRKTIGLKFS